MGKTIRGLTSYSGGGAGSLDLIDGGSLSNGDRAEVRTSLGVFDYYLDASSGAAESLPYIVSPDTNPGTKRWILVISQGPMSHVRYTKVSQSIPNTGTPTIVTYDTKTHDLLNEFSAGVFTAIYTGIYSIKASAGYGAGIWTVLDQHFMDIYLDGVVAKVKRKLIEANTGSNLNPYIDNMDSLLVTAGQTLDVRLSHTRSAGAISLVGNPTYNVISIDRLS